MSACQLQWLNDQVELGKMEMITTTNIPELKKSEKINITHMKFQIKIQHSLTFNPGRKCSILTNSRGKVFKNYLTALVIFIAAACYEDAIIHNDAWRVNIDNILFSGIITR